MKITCSATNARCTESELDQLSQVQNSKMRGKLYNVHVYIGSTYMNLLKDKIKHVIINFIYCMEFWHFWSMSIMVLFGEKLTNSKIDDLDIKSAFKVKELDSFTLTIA